MKNKVMAAKNKKVKTMAMKASKERALDVSMAELMWGDWAPYFVWISKDGVDMYRSHAEFMKAWNERKAVTV